MTKEEVLAAIDDKLSIPVSRDEIYESFETALDYVTESKVSAIIPDWTAGAMTFQTDGSDDGRLCFHPDTNGNKRIFETKIDDNINNEPPTDPDITENASWKEVSQSPGSAIKEWQAGVYGAGLIIVYYDHSVDGPGIYLLKDPTRPFVSSNIEDEIETGKWLKLHPTDSLVVDASGDIALDGMNSNDRTFILDAVVNAAKAWSVANVRKFTVAFEIGGALPVQTFWATIVISTNAGIWNNATKEWTPLDPGKYTLEVITIGAEHRAKLFGPYT